MLGPNFMLWHLLKQKEKCTALVCYCEVSESWGRIFDYTFEKGKHEVNRKHAVVLPVFFLLDIFSQSMWSLTFKILYLFNFLPVTMVLFLHLRTSKKNKGGACKVLCKYKFVKLCLLYFYVLCIYFYIVYFCRCR